MIPVFFDAGSGVVREGFEVIECSVAERAVVLAHLCCGPLWRRVTELPRGFRKPSGGNRLDRYIFSLSARNSATMSLAVVVIGSSAYTRVTCIGRIVPSGTFGNTMSSSSVTASEPFCRPTIFTADVAARADVERPAGPVAHWRDRLSTTRSRPAVGGRDRLRYRGGDDIVKSA